jgi:hypothetical protein
MSEKIKKTNWISTFRLIGKAKIYDNSFKIDEVSQNGWQYNNLNLGVDCGEKYGNVYANLMGGFSQNNKGVIYVHGKKDDGTDDWDNSFTVDWDDRNDDEILDSVGEMCFIKVGLETTEKGNTYTQKFLSAYDAIAYIHEHLENDTVINVQGNMRYSYYKDGVNMQRNITSIFLSKTEPENFRATFTQSILIDKDSINLKEDVDKERNSVKIHARVLDYVKELNGVEFKKQYPLPFTFEYEYPSKEAFEKIYKMLFKVKKGVTQINFEGNFINSGATVQATMDDVTDDVKLLIDMGLYTEEEILTKYASQGNLERRYILTRPVVKIEGDEENRVAVPQIFAERYTEDDLEIQIENSKSDSDSESLDFSAIIDDDDDLGWLSEL